jgi:hypothetical protein
MKIKTPLKKTIFFIALIVAVSSGVYIGIATVYRYEVIVKGILGLANLYLIQLLFVPPKNFVSKSIGIQVEFPRDFQYIASAFFLSTIMYWSGQNLLDTILFFMRFLVSK